MKKVPVQISVIIATKNEEKNIGRLLASLTQQTFKDFEIIVVDNYSTDKTRQIAKQFTKMIYQIPPERSSQKNFGLKKARGQYVLFLDADMTCQQHLLTECLKTFEKKPKIAGIVIPEEAAGTGFLAKIKALEKKLYQDQALIEAPRFARTGQVAQIGGFDEDLVAGEDWDLGNRLINFGNFAKVTAKIYHHEQKSFFQDIRKKYYYALHIQKYAEKYPEIFKYQASFARFSSLLKKPKMVLEKPIDFIGLLFLKSAQYLAYLAAKIALFMPLKNE